MDSDTNGILNGADTGWGMFTNQYTQFGRPFPPPAVPTDEAFLAYEKRAGFRRREPGQARSGGHEHCRQSPHPDRPAHRRARRFASVEFHSAFLDTDQDGIPDFWETTFGQNPTNVSKQPATTTSISSATPTWKNT